MPDLPVLYSFRRCPFAMRARLAIASAGITCALREVVLRDKPPEMLGASPKGTVPVVVDDGKVIEESLDIMRWALGRNDPEGLLNQPDAAQDLIAVTDGSFKAALDRYKYADRYADADPGAERTAGAAHLRRLDAQLDGRDWLFGDAPRMADFAILPFVRQFAHVDLDWFDAQDWPHLAGWLVRFKRSDRFARVMRKYPKWMAGEPVTLFPDPAGTGYRT